VRAILALSRFVALRNRALITLDLDFANTIRLLEREVLSGRLWIVESGRIRIHD
jgi:hypothetical protein